MRSAGTVRRRCCGPRLRPGGPHGTAATLVIATMGWPLWAAVAVGVAALAFAAGLLVAGARGDRSRDREDPLPPEPEARRAAEPPPAAPRRVLVVDDDPGLRLLLRTTLALDDLEVE